MIAKQSKRGRPPKYPWNKWLTGGRITLCRYDDFTCEPFSFAILARREVQKRGLKVTVKVRGRTGIIDTGDNGE